MKRLWYKIKSRLWAAALVALVVLGIAWFIYNLLRPTKNKNQFLSGIQTKVNSAIKENEIRATLEKDKIGAIKKIYDRKLKATTQIADREERLKALIRMHEELDL